MIPPRIRISLALLILTFALSGVAFAQGGSWVTKAPMPTARWSLGVGVVNGILYAVGGIDSASTDTSAVEAYDPVSNTWSTKAPMPTARHSFGVGVVNGILYAVGGSSFINPYLSTVEAYDPASNTWATKAPMPMVQEGHAVGVVNGILYAVGGQVGTYSSTLQAYDPGVTHGQRRRRCRRRVMSQPLGWWMASSMS